MAETTLAVQMAELRDDIRGIREDFSEHDQADQDRHKELRREMSELRTELRADITAVRIELRSDIQAAAATVSANSTRIQLAQLALVLAALAILGGLVGVKLTAAPDGGLHVEGPITEVVPVPPQASP